MPDQTQNPTPHAGAPKSRSVAALWGSGAVAATILVLGVNGTLSSWTSAVITNDTNEVSSAQAVILSETDGTSNCYSSGDTDDATNSFVCSTINKYGGETLAPGGSDFTDVTFSNVGAADAASFEIDPGLCSQTPTAGSSTPPVANLCTNGDLTVALDCSPGETYVAASKWIDLTYTAAVPPTATVAHTSPPVLTDLDAGDSWTCRFTVALDNDASVLAQGVTVSQPLTWTLTQVS